MDERTQRQNRKPSQSTHYLTKKNMNKRTKKLNGWKVHTPNLLKEVLANPSCAILKIPISIFGKLLFEVGERASELNDHKLNELMIRLAIYSVADPESKDYDSKIVRQYLNKEIV